MSQSKGLGDDIATIAKKLGIDKISDKLAKALGKDDCGCKKRQTLLNKLVPHKKK